VQHKTALGLHRAALKHGLRGQVFAAQGQIHLVEQALEVMSLGLLMTRPSAPRSLCSHR
jgi:hypothetical protein